MEWIDKLAAYAILGNSLLAYIKCASILLLGYVLKRYGARVISRQSFRVFRQMARNQFSEMFVSMLSKPVERLISLFVLYLAFNQLSFPESWELANDTEYGLKWFIRSTFWLVVVVRLCQLCLSLVEFLTHVLQNREDATVSIELSNFLKELIKVLTVVLFVFAALHFVYSVNITALVASLGIGGLAIALAAQDTLANLIASFIIYIDKPFKVNDLVDFDGITGRVEHVGFRTTRVRTLDKSLLTVPNKKLIDAALNNVTLSESRRVRFTIGLTYQTTSEQLREIIADIQQVIQQHPKTNDDYFVRFAEINSSALEVLILYFVTSNEFADMINTKEEINFKIMEIVRKHQASFAYPTQSIILENMPPSNTH